MPCNNRGAAAATANKTNEEEELARFVFYCTRFDAHNAAAKHGFEEAEKLRACAHSLSRSSEEPSDSDSLRSRERHGRLQPRATASEESSPPAVVVPFPAQLDLTDCEFLDTVAQTVVDGRNFLKWSYVREYYSTAGDDSDERALFLYRQGKLESLLDELSGTLATFRETCMRVQNPGRVPDAPMDTDAGVDGSPIKQFDLVQFADGVA